jgi:hypothetical protein
LRAVKRNSLLVLCLFLALPVAPALAKSKKVTGLGPVLTAYEVGNVATSDNLESTATASCPAGKQAVGGGFAAPLDPGSALVVHDSYRSSPTTWTVSGTLVDGRGFVSAYAYCRNRKGHPITDVSASTSFNDSGEIQTLTPSCPSGKLIGGGFQATTVPGDEAVVFPQVNQAIFPKTWSVTGVANQDGPRALTAHAYCMARVKAPTLVTVTNSALVGQFGAIASSAQCPLPKGKKKKKGQKRRKKVLSAGGFAATPVNGSPGLPSMVFGQSRSGGGAGWVVSASNAFDAPGVTSVTSQAICL